MSTEEEPPRQEWEEWEESHSLLLFLSLSSWGTLSKSSLLWAFTFPSTKRRRAQAYLILLCVTDTAFFFLQSEGLWRLCVKGACWPCFSKSICSLLVSASYSSIFCKISTFSLFLYFSWSSVVFTLLL